MTVHVGDPPSPQTIITVGLTGVNCTEGLPGVNCRSNSWSDRGQCAAGLTGLTADRGQCTTGLTGLTADRVNCTVILTGLTAQQV